MRRNAGRRATFELLRFDEAGQHETAIVTDSVKEELSCQRIHVLLITRDKVF